MMKTVSRGYGRVAIRGLLAIAVLAGACSDEDGIVDIDEDFIGNWNSVSFIADGVELVGSTSAFFVSFGFFEDGSYQFIVSGDDAGLLCDTPPSCQDQGDYEFSSTVLTIDPNTVDELELTYSVSGSTLTVSGNLDGTPFTAVFERN